MNLTESEKVLFKKAANLFRGIEAVGGWLTVTNERMIFNPHSINIQKEPLELFYNDLAGIEKRNTLLIVPNGVRIILKSGKDYKFVVWKRSAFIKFIREKINYP